MSEKDQDSSVNAEKNIGDESADRKTGQGQKMTRVEELEAEIDRLRTALEGRIDRETILNGLNYREGGPLTIAVTPPEFVRRFLAELFVIAMDDAPNFQAGSFNWKAQDYEMTIRRISGKPVSEKVGELRAALQPFADMHREGSEPDEIACMRGTGFEKTIITSGDFQRAFEVLNERLPDPPEVKD